MDALARLEPVARDLMGRVDTALVTLGAPAEHPVWARLREVGGTPADAVAFFARADAGPLRDTAAALRDRAEAYEEAEIPVDLPWRGAAGEAYVAAATALRVHLAGTPGHAGEDCLAERLRRTAAYADDVADWYQRSRDRLARTLAEVLACAQAVTVRSSPALSEGITPRVPVAAVTAAADIGAQVLGAAAEAVADGEAVGRRWAPSLGELAFRRAAGGPDRLDATIEVHRA